MKKLKKKSGKLTFKYVVINWINNYCFGEFFYPLKQFGNFLDNILYNIMNLILIKHSVYNLNNLKVNNYITYKETEK